jgi:hypothetical protein
VRGKWGTLRSLMQIFANFQFKVATFGLLDAFFPGRTFTPPIGVALFFRLVKGVMDQWSNAW